MRLNARLAVRIGSAALLVGAAGFLGLALWMFYGLDPWDAPAMAVVLVLGLTAMPLLAALALGILGSYLWWATGASTVAPEATPR